MRTVINPIHSRTFVREELGHSSINRPQGFRRTISAAHDCLITDNHDGTAEPIDHSNPFGSPWKQFHTLHRGEVILLDVDRSIAIEKNSMRSCVTCWTYSWLEPKDAEFSSLCLTCAAILKRTFIFNAGRQRLGRFPISRSLIRRLSEFRPRTPNGPGMWRIEQAFSRRFP